MIRVFLTAALALITEPALAGVGGHGNALTPFTVGYDGWTVIGSTAGTGQANCGTGTPNNNPGTCWFYVASTGTDGANVCTNINSPCLTIEHARVQLRSGKPDHLNIKCGDTIPFSATLTMILSNVGKSATEPAVITTYCPGLPEGSGVRPTLQGGCNAGGLSFFGQNGGLGNSVAVINLSFYWNTRDPVNNPGEYNPACTGASSIPGFSFGASTNTWVLLEGNSFEYSGGNSAQVGSAAIFVTNFLMRRNLLLGAWTISSANGFFSDGISLNGAGTDGTFLMEENVFAQNGWNSAATTSISSATYNSGTGLVTLVTSGTTGLTSASTTTVSGVTGTGANLVNITTPLTVGTNGTTLVYSVGMGQTISGLSGGTVTGLAAGSLQHCIYINYGSDATQPAYPLSTVKLPEITIPVVYRGNFVLQCADSDQFRNGGELEFNAWVGNPGCASIGGTVVNATDNLCTENRNLYVSEVPNGAGFDIGTGNNPNFTTLPTRSQTVTRNNFAHNNGTGQTAALNMQGLACNPSLEQCTIPSTGFKAGGNLVCAWTGGGGIPSPGPTEGAILTLDATSLMGGSGGTPGIYPGIQLTGGSGTGAIAAVVVGPGGNATSVNITQFGGVGALSTMSAAGTTTLTVTNRQAGSVIVPNNGTVTTQVVDAGNVPPGGAVQIVAQLTSTEPGGALYGNGTYQLSGARTWDSVGAVFTATGTGTSLNVSSMTTGKLRIGGGQNQVIAGNGVPTNTIISSQVSGSPIASNITASIGATTTGTGAGTSLTLSGTVGLVSNGDSVSGTGVPANTTIVSGGPGGDGTYVTNNATTSSGASLIIRSNVLNVTATSASIAVNQIVVGSSVSINSLISSQISGSGGLTGTYRLSSAVQQIASEAMTTAPTGLVGVYVTSVATTANNDTLTAVSPVNGYPTGQTETFPNPNGGTQFVIGDTLTIPGGAGAGQVPGLSGASIKVATVAHNDFTTPTANTVQTANCNSLGPNSTITVASYNASIGGAATTQDFVNRVIAKSKSDANGKNNWPYNLSAYALVNAFKSGYGQMPNAPVY